MVPESEVIVVAALAVLKRGGDMKGATRRVLLIFWSALI